MEDFITLQLPINLPIEVIVKPATVDFITNKASMFIQIINVKNYVQHLDIMQDIFLAAFIFPIGTKKR